jgi:Ca2+:H+ antiporter
MSENSESQVTEYCEGEPRRKWDNWFHAVYPRQPFTVANQIQRTLLGQWINVLLVCIPVGIALRFVTGYSAATFAVNFAATVPLLFMSDFALTEISKRLNKILTTLLYLSV